MRVSTWKRIEPNEFPGVYLSGPMTGRPDLNRAEFARWEMLLRSCGVQNVFNPAAQDRPEDWTWERHMMADLQELTSGRYGMLLLLPDHDCSRGSALEMKVAAAIGMKVVKAVWT